MCEEVGDDCIFERSWFGMFLLYVETYLWRQAVADGGVYSVGVSRRGHKAVRVT